MKKKFNKNEWLFAAIVYPLIWLFLPYAFVKDEGCLHGKGGNLACGYHAWLVIAVWFVFCMAFPCIYFLKILPDLKKEKDDALRDILKSEFNIKHSSSEDGDTKDN